MNSLERVLTTLGHAEPDRVPVFLLLTMHGAKELDLSIEEYFSRAENMVEGQLRLQQKFGHDCIYTFCYASVETEAWGGSVLYAEDGPPNAGEPLVDKLSSVPSLQPPSVSEAPCLRKVLDATRLLKEKVGDTVPIIGVVMSPFSLPIMQLGFEEYLELIFNHPDWFQNLMHKNEAFCVEWANAQLAAGATAICYFDPMSSTTIIPSEWYETNGVQLAKRTIAQIKGPTATHFASGRCLPIVDALAKTGTAVVGVSGLEDLTEVKRAFRKRFSILGNLNGIEMVDWDVSQTQENVKACLEKGAPGGGFILSDNHGEIPFQVKDETLYTIMETVKSAGTYPIQN